MHKLKPCLPIFVCLILQSVIPAAAEPVPTLETLPDCRYRAASFNTPASKTHWAFPDGDLFRPLLADPKQPQFVAGRQRVNPNNADDFAAAWVGFGENFGLYRLTLGRACDGLQLNVNGGVFAQFNLDSPSSDLVNADYVIGVPLTFRKDFFSGRLRYYHQSSHLGDELILGNPGIRRINLSFEEVEFLASFELYFLRVYGGPGYLVRREPDLERWKWQYGGELRFPLNRPPDAYIFYFVAGSDFKQFQEHDYHRDYSVKAGVEVENDRAVRRLRVLFTLFDGFNPFGQFYDQKLRAIGFEINLGF
jgi:hypothetical protein